MKTTKKLWVGFGALTALLVLFGVLMAVRLQSVDRNVHRMADVARPRADATRELKLNVLEHALNVISHLADRSGRNPEIKIAAAEIDRHLAVYETLVETSRQRELAAKFAVQWRELDALGETLMDAVRVTPEDLERFVALRIRLEMFLTDEMQRDALASYSARKESAFQDIRALVGFLLVLTASGGVGGFLTSVMVGRSIVRTEKDLCEQIERYQLVAAGAGDAIWNWDVTNHRVDFSPRWKELRGFAPEEVSDREEEWNSGIHPDDVSRVRAAVQAHFEGKTAYFAEEYRIRCKDGSWKWVLDRGIARRDATGRVDRMAGSESDITDRKQAEEKLCRLTTELRAKVDELSTLIDILPGAVLMADAQCHRITGNRAFYEMIGLPQGANASLTAEQPDLPAGIRVYHDGRELPPDEFPMQATGRTGRRIIGFDHDLVFPDGRVLSLLANTAPLLDEHGAVRGVLGFYMDICERKRAEDALRDRTARLRAILNTAVDAIITIDNRGIIQSVNPATQMMFGYTNAEMVGQNVSMLMPSPHRDHHDAYIRRYLETGNAQVIGVGRELFALRKNGSVFPVDLAVSAVPELKFFTGILRDITQRKNAEEALRESERFARSTLDGLSAHIAILGESGTILAVNQPWRAVSAANSPADSPVPNSVEEGANYLGICEKSVGQFSEEGPAAAAGIRAVLSKKLPEFTLEYPCHRPHEERWFLMRVTPFPGDVPRRVVVAHENITQRKVLEREVVEIASLEQRRIGQDLHDSVGQELTALNMFAADLAASLRNGPSNVLKLAERIVQGLQRSQRELRAVLRGLLPVPIDTEGLMAALSDLADRIQQEGKANCRFECPEPVLVADTLTATHLYLIVQEAVHNAVKHAQPGNISIFLSSNHHLLLRVQDDGIGMPAQPTEKDGCLGLRIMRNRAAIIGATLTIEPAEPTGTLVVCTLARKNNIEP